MKHFKTRSQIRLSHFPITTPNKSFNISLTNVPGDSKFWGYSLYWSCLDDLNKDAAKSDIYKVFHDIIGLFLATCPPIKNEYSISRIANFPLNV